MHEFLCVKRYFLQGSLADTALNKMIQIVLTNVQFASQTELVKNL